MILRLAVDGISSILVFHSMIHHISCLEVVCNLITVSA